ncbi:MAG: hypothetical protein DRO09_00620 [Thermoprotei archaeon]|nr:MAG: hypothetical protein DRO09_00620 [Thermoprotei archaeon]
MKTYLYTLTLLPILLAIPLAWLNAVNRQLSIASWACQLQGADPKTIASSGFDLVVMDYSRDGSRDGEYFKAEIAQIRRQQRCKVTCKKVDVVNHGWYHEMLRWFSG